MRIIAGQFRSRILLGPEDAGTTRPITDRVKQSLFDMLAPLMEQAVIYDCFAGTGSMGLESLSRGAAHANFFEADRSALLRLKNNIASLKVETQSTVHTGDLFKWFSAAPVPQIKADLIFLDPPYRFLNEQPAKLKALAAHFAGHMNQESLMIFRHDANDHLELPALKVVDVRTHGQMTLEMLRRGPVSEVI